MARTSLLDPGGEYMALEIFVVSARTNKRYYHREKCVISHSNTKKVEVPYQSEGGIEVMMLFIGTRLSNLYTAVDTSA